MTTATLPGRWQFLILSLVITQAVTLWALFKLSSYAVWLHFDGDTRLLSTLPGKFTAMGVGAVVGVLVLVNLRNFTKAASQAVTPATPEERARRPAEAEPGDDA